MATVARLVETLSQFLMVPIADIQHRARRLREAGLLPADGLGRGAPHVDSYHCATLLVAILATDTATHAPEAVQEVDRKGDAVRAFFGKTELVVAPASTFVAAIAYVIDHLKKPETQGKWYNMVRRVGVRTSGDSEPRGWIENNAKKRTDYGVLTLRFGVDPHGYIRPLETVLPGLTWETSVGVRELMGIAFMLERG